MLIDDIRTFLIAQSVVDANPATDGSGWPCYLGYYPDDFDQMVGIFDTGGYPADTLNRENERRTFQVRVRAARLSYQTGHDKWKAIFDVLQDSTPAVDYYYVQAMHYGPMAFNDDRGRPNFTANFRVMKARS